MFCFFRACCKPDLPAEFKNTRPAQMQQVTNIRVSLSGKNKKDKKKDSTLPQKSSAGPVNAANAGSTMKNHSQANLNNSSGSQGSLRTPQQSVRAPAPMTSTVSLVNPGGTVACGPATLRGVNPSATMGVAQPLAQLSQTTIKPATSTDALMLTVRGPGPFASQASLVKMPAQMQGQAPIMPFQLASNSSLVQSNGALQAQAPMMPFQSTSMSSVNLNNSVRSVKMPAQAQFAPSIMPMHSAGNKNIATNVNGQTVQSSPFVKMPAQAQVQARVPAMPMASSNNKNSAQSTGGQISSSSRLLQPTAASKQRFDGKEAGQNLGRPGTSQAGGSSAQQFSQYGRNMQFGFVPASRTREALGLSR